MKKVLCLMTVFCLILPFIFTISSYAVDYDVSFSIGSMNMQRGETSTVIVNMNCTNSFSAANFVLTYDSNVLEYVPYLDEYDDVDYNQNCGSTILNNSGVPIGTVLINSETLGTIKIGYMSTKSVAGKSGEFLKFKFKAKSNAAYGNSTISLSSTTLKDSSGNNLNASYSSGVISILSGITMNNSSINLTVGESGQLSVTASNGTIYNNVSWTSSDSSVVSVTPSSDTKSATINAVSAGTATITATVGGVSTSSTITINEPEVPYTISITNAGWTFLPPTQIRSTVVTFDPTASAEGKTITWSSSNTNVATISSSTGEITAVAAGTSTITATDGNKSATYTLTVSGTLGNVGDDENITSYDAYRALVVYAEQATNGTVNQNEVVLLDVERNGDMSSNDAYLILKYSVGLISNFN